jgi:transcriptional regulator with XRE-family HTH domain
MTGKNLREWRKNQGWNQTQTARYLGVTQAAVSRWEDGGRTIPTTVYVLTYLLNFSVNISRVENLLCMPLDR